jgi:membrane-associated phospholipid phosphatase
MITLRHTWIFLFEKLSLLGDIGSVTRFLGTFIVFLVNSDMCIIIYTLGYVINSYVNHHIFKKYIVDSRPYISGENRMPSGHAQAVSYTFFFYLFLVIIRREYQHVFHYCWLIFLSFVSINTSVVCYINAFHTLEQVLIGYVVGAFHAFLFTRLLL